MRIVNKRVLGIATFALLAGTSFSQPEALAATSKSSYESTVEKHAASVFDNQVDLTVEDAFRLPSNSQPSKLDSELSSSETFQVKISRAGAKTAKIVCAGANTNGKAIDSPHYSKGAGGAIFKTRIQCSGYGATTVRVRAQGLLSFAAAKNADDTGQKKFKKRADSDYWQTINVNGPAVTFYTPQPGKHGGVGKGFWMATSTWYYHVAGVTSTVGSETQVKFRNIVEPKASTGPKPVETNN